MSLKGPFFSVLAMMADQWLQNRVGSSFICMIQTLNQRLSLLEVL